MGEDEQGDIRKITRMMSLVTSWIDSMQGIVDNIKSYMALQDEKQQITKNIVAKQGKQIAKLVNDFEMHLTSMSKDVHSAKVSTIKHS